MADIFDQVATAPAQGDIFDQVSTVNQPSGPEKFWAEHPYFKAAGDTLQQAFVNPVVQGLNAIVPAINGIGKGLGFPEDQPGREIKGPDMTNAPFAAKVLGDVAGGASKGIAATAIGGGNPLLGFGAMGGLEAFGKNEPVAPAVLKGAESAIPQMVAGKLGSNLAKAGASKFGEMFGRFAPQVEKYAPNVGTGAGMAAAGATMAPEGERTRAAASGAAFGLVSPMKPYSAKNDITQQAHNEMVDKHAQVYQSVLNPGKNILNSSNIDVSKATKTLAKSGVIIRTNASGRLDNTDAINQLQEANKPYYDEAQKIISSDPNKTFDLNEVAAKAKAQMKPYFKNAEDLHRAQGQVDNAIYTLQD